MPRCEICGKDDFKLISAELREGPGRICQCKSCGLVIQDAAWTSEDIERYYNEEYQKAHSLDVNKEQSPQEHFASRLKTIKPLVDRIHKALKKDMSATKHPVRRHSQNTSYCCCGPWFSNSFAEG